MSALHAPGSEHPGNRRQPNPPLGLIDRWAQLAVDRPWRYAAAWAIGIGAANLGLRMLLNDLSLARNAPLAILTGVGFLGFAWYTPPSSPAHFGGSGHGRWPIRPAPSRAVRLAGAPDGRAADPLPAGAPGPRGSGRALEP
jgi:hypothetical protein